MGGLDSIFASAVEAARAAVESSFAIVTHEAWLSQSGTGVPVYDTPVERLAMVQEGQTEKRLNGKTMSIKAIVTFYPAGDGEAPPVIGVHDRITLPSGRSWPISQVKESLVSPSGTIYVRTVWLA